MKNRILPFVAMVGLCGGLVLTGTGCAGSATHQSTGEYVDDAAITGKVKAAFVKDPTVSAMQVKVDTFKGTVQLNGFVDTQDQKARAEQIAKGVQGVQNVQNNITVKAAATP